MIYSRFILGLLIFGFHSAPPPPLSQHTPLLWLKSSYLKRTSYFIPFRFVVVFTTIPFVQQNSISIKTFFLSLLYAVDSIAPTTEILFCNTSYSPCHTLTFESYLTSSSGHNDLFFTFPSPTQYKLPFTLTQPFTLATFPLP